MKEKEETKGEKIEGWGAGRQFIRPPQKECVK